MTYEPTGRDPARPANRGRTDNGDLVERLVRLAEPGPELPQRGAERVKEALRDEWRREVSRRRRRRAALWAAGTLAAAAIVALAVTALLNGRTPLPQGPVPVGRIVAARGDVQLVPPAGGPSRSLAPGDRDVLAAGSRLLTGPSGLAAVALPGGASLRLDSGSSARLSSPRTIFLDRGAVYVDSKGDIEGVTIATQFGVVKEIGTQFEVRHGGNSLRVRVREGAVRLSGRDAPLEVRAGTSLEMSANGSATRSAIDPDDADWSWTYAIAPPLDIEGSSADAFLRWAARETGLTLEYDGPATEALARGCILHGSLAGLTPPETPAVVLPSCGLIHRVDGGRLVVDELPPGDVTRHYPTGAT